MRGTGWGRPRTTFWAWPLWVNNPLGCVDPAGLDSWAESFLDWTGGRRHVPVADPGLAQDAVILGCEAFSAAVLAVASGGTTVAATTGANRASKVYNQSRGLEKRPDATAGFRSTLS